MPNYWLPALVLFSDFEPPFLVNKMVFLFCSFVIFNLKRNFSIIAWNYFISRKSKIFICDNNFRCEISNRQCSRTALLPGSWRSSASTSTNSCSPMHQHRRCDYASGQSAASGGERWRRRHRFRSVDWSIYLLSESEVVALCVIHIAFDNNTNKFNCFFLSVYGMCRVNFGSLLMSQQ